MEIEQRIRQIGEQLSARQTEMVGLLERLIRYESPSHDRGALDGFAGMLAGEIGKLGLEPRRVRNEAYPDIIECYGGRAGRPVMLLGHTDTVWPIGTLDRMPVRIEGDRLFGPGSYDMKGGIVAALYAMQALGADSPRVHLFLTSLEEVGGAAYRDLLEQRAQASRAVLGLEPAWPGGAVKTERKGVGGIVVRARGKAAHAGANPEKGVNAIVELARQIATIDALRHDMPEGVSLNVGLVRGGSRPNVVPDFAEIEIDMRFKRQADGEAALGRLKQLSAVLPGAAVEVTGDLKTPPLERTDQVLKLYSLARRTAEIQGWRLDEISTGGASEVCYAAALGVPCLDGLGVDGDGAHAIDEHVVISSLPKRAALVAGTILLLDEHGAGV